MRLNPKILITGPGRAGTTCIMRCLNRLDMDTGMDAETEQKHYFKEIHAGCEFIAGQDLTYTIGKENEFIKTFNGFPRILKSPDFSFFINLLLETKLAKIEHIILPIRNSQEVAKSRMKNKELLGWGCDDVPSLVVRCRYVIGEIVEQCELSNIPYTIVRFPKSVEEPRYLWKMLQRSIPEMNEVPYRKFKRVFDEVNRTQ